MSVDVHTVSLSEDEMWQSFVAIRAVRKSLLEITTVSGDVIEGFITGIDEDWIQLTSRGNYEAILINLGNISHTKDTSKTLMGLFHEEEISMEEVKRVEQYSFNTRQAARSFLENKKMSREAGRDN